MTIYWNGPPPGWKPKQQEPPKPAPRKKKVKQPWFFELDDDDLPADERTCRLVERAVHARNTRRPTAERQAWRDLAKYLETLGPIGDSFWGRTMQGDRMENQTKAKKSPR